MNRFVTGARYFFLFSFALIVLLSQVIDVHAAGSAGIEVGLDSARALGKGNAVVADPQDASTMAYNPAGLTQLEKPQIATNFTTIVGLPSYTNTRGASEDGATILAYIPAFFVSTPTPVDKLKVGFGVDSPFGLQDHYSSTGSFKYTGFYNQIRTIYYNGSAAYQLNDWLSLGGGVSYVQTKLRQNSKFNTSAISAANGDPTGYADANSELDADGDGVGWNLGVLLKPDSKWSLGFLYRSAVRSTVDGSYDVDNIQGAFVMQPIFGGSSFHTTVKTTMTLPDSAVIGAMYRFTDKLSVETDLGWTGWGKFDHFDFNYGTTNAVLSAGNPSQHKFQDTFSVNIGTQYALNPNWSLLGGYAYFHHATLEQDYSNVFPDGDRHNVTVGLQYNIKNVTISLAYAAQFVADSNIDNTVGNINSVSIDGKYQNFYHVAVASVVYRFG